MGIPHVVDLLAYRHHMSWLKMRADTSAGGQESRKEDFREHLHCLDVTGWGVKISGEKGMEVGRMPTLNSCRFCKKCVKAPYSPETFYGKDTGRIARNRTECATDEPYSCGMMQEGTNYPLLNANWRAPGPLCPLAVEYRRAVDVEFSLLDVQNVETLGSRIERDRGDVRQAARGVKEIEMRKLEHQVRDASSLLRNHTVLRDRIEQLHTTGALPFSQGQPHGKPRPRGFPYDASKTVEMAQELWEDLREGRVLIATSHVAGDDDPLIATPTTTVMKRLPDRTMSDDCRIISDMRFRNLFCDKEDCPEVKMADVR